MASSNKSTQFRFKSYSNWPSQQFESFDKNLNNDLILPVKHLSSSQQPSGSFEIDLDQESISFSKKTFASKRSVFSTPVSVSFIKNSSMIPAQENIPVGGLEKLYETNDMITERKSVVTETNRQIKPRRRSPPPPPPPSPKISSTKISIGRTNKPSVSTTVTNVTINTHKQDTSFKTITTESTTVTKTTKYSSRTDTKKSDVSVKSSNQQILSNVERKDEKNDTCAPKKSLLSTYSKKISLDNGTEKQLSKNNSNKEQTIQPVLTAHSSIADIDSKEVARSFSKKQEEQQQLADRLSSFKQIERNSYERSSSSSPYSSKPKISSLADISLKNNHENNNNNYTTVDNTSLKCSKYNRNLSDSSFSDEEEDSEQKCIDSSATSSSEMTDKLYKCIEELWKTEKTYVHILNVLSSELPFEVNKLCGTDDAIVNQFNSTYKPLLGALQAIYKLHCDTLLPKLTPYVHNWETLRGNTSRNVWSIFHDNSQFISVLYKDYYVRISESQTKLDDLCKLHSCLNDAMLKVQTFMGNLYPMSQLNCPNQRLLRYILCMKTYMKYLDKQSKEYQLTKSIHDELDRTACDCQEALTVSSIVLNDLNDRLDNKFECYKDQRKLLWCGYLKKQSPRTNRDIAQRYVILFSDCMLVCNELSSKKLEIKKELSIKNMTVDEVHSTDSNNSNTSLNMTVSASLSSLTELQQQQQQQKCRFRINAIEKAYEFIADDEKDKQIWIKKIEQAIDEYSKRVTHIIPRKPYSTETMSTSSTLLGFRAPIWVNDVDVSRCQICNTKFPQINIVRISLSNKHHCRACGKAVCSSCSSKKCLLDYNKAMGESRVCDACYNELTAVTKQSPIITSSPRPRVQLVNVTRDPDQTILFSDFRYDSKSLWVALQEDLELHVYGARLDKAEDFSIKLKTIHECSYDYDSHTITIRETSTSKPHIFVFDTTHQIYLPKNDIIANKIEEKSKIQSGYDTHFDLWREAIEAARTSTYPPWYINKRDSLDSDVSVRS